MKSQDIKIIFFGTPEFALPALDALIKNGYKIVAVVTNPDEPVGRKQILTPPLVKVWAEKHKIPVLQPEDLKIPPELPEAELFIVAAYGKIIPKEILDIPRLGVLNIHPSLLPKWRGASPIQASILAGDTETGVTIMKMDEKMDHGPIVAQRRLETLNSKFEILKTTYSELYEELAKLGAELLIKILPKYIKGEITPKAQDDNSATFCKILRKDDGRMDWKRPAEELDRKVRALNRWPGCWTIWPTGDKIMRVRIEQAEALPDISPEGSEGYIFGSENAVLVKCGKGSLRLEKLTLEGKKSMDIDAFLHGYKDFIGSNLV